MANTLSAQVAPTTAEYEAEFELLMQEAAWLNELMAKNRVETIRQKLSCWLLLRKIVVPGILEKAGVVEYQDVHDRGKLKMPFRKNPYNGCEAQGT